MFMSRAMKSVCELGVGDLVSKFETKNSMTFSKLREGLNREVKEEFFFLGVYLSVLVKH